MLLIDGVRYQPHKYRDELELESMVKEHAKDIFGEDSIYFGKKEILSLSGIGSIPDGYAITFKDPPRWYFVEIELSSRPIFEHIVPQINKFVNGIKSEATKRELIDYMYREIGSKLLIEHLIKERFGEVHKFLSELVYKQPTILIVIDRTVKELDDVLASIPCETKVLEFKTFVREGVGLNVHAHLFEPLIERPPPPVKEEPRVEGAKVGDTLEITISTESYRKYALFIIPKERRLFFPGYKEDFILETDIGEIITRVTGAKKGTHLGDPGGGNYIQGGLRKWYDKHPELILGRKVRFECIEPHKRYRLIVL